MLNFKSITDLKIGGNAVAKVYLKSADGETKTLLWTRGTIPLSVPKYLPYKDNIFYNLVTNTADLDLETYIEENVVPNQYIGEGFDLETDPNYPDESKFTYSWNDLKTLYEDNKKDKIDEFPPVYSPIVLSARSGYEWDDGSGNLYPGVDTLETFIYICSLDNVSTTTVDIESPTNNTFTIADAYVDTVSLYSFLRRFLYHTSFPTSGGLWFQLEIPQNIYFDKAVYDIFPLYQDSGYVVDDGDDGDWLPLLYTEDDNSGTTNVEDYGFSLPQIVKYPDTTNQTVDQPFVVKAMYTDAESHNTEIASMTVPLKFNISCKINSSIVNSSDITITRDGSNVYNAELSISDSFVTDLESWGIDLTDPTIASGVTLSYEEDIPLFSKGEPSIDWSTRKLTLPIMTSSEYWGTGTTTISFGYTRPEGVTDTPSNITTSQTLTVHIPSINNDPTSSYSLDTATGWTISNNTTSNSATASMVWNTGTSPETVDAQVVPLDDSATSYSVSTQNNVVTITNSTPSMRQRIQVIVQAIDPNGAYQSYTHIFQGDF